MARLLFLQNIDFEFFGPMYISSYAKNRGHDVRLVIGDKAEDFEAAIQSYKPDLLAFSIMTGGHGWARDTARDMKARHGLRSLFGGAHPTFFPEFILDDGVDLLVRGEGEEAVCDVLDCIDAGRPLDQVANLVWKDENGRTLENPVRSLGENLDDYPFPDRTLYRDLDGRLDRSVKSVITSRGCPFNCSFCFEEAMRKLYAGKGKFVRLRSVSNVIAELKDLRDSSTIRTIYFADDFFGMNRRWLYEFLEEYKREIRLPFICLMRADIIAANPEYARRLADGGCKSIFFGIETGNEKLRNEVLKKQLSNEQIRIAANRLHDAGIKFRTYNIVGLPGETLENSFETLNLNIDIRADYPWCSVFMPFPGTALTQFAVDNGYLGPEFSVEALSKSFFTTSCLKMPDIARMSNLQKFFQTTVLWPWVLPFVKLLIKLPPNPLFSLWFGMIYFYVYIRSENKKFRETMKFALRNFRHHFE